MACTQHVQKCSSSVYYGRISCEGHFGSLCLASLHLTLAAQRCVLCRQRFTSSACQVVEGAIHASTTKVNWHCWKEWTSWFSKEGVPKNAMIYLNLRAFLLHLFRFGLAWCTTGIHHLVGSAFVEPYHLHKALNHPIIF